MDSGVYEKLKILSDGAKYDVSCASSGVDRTNVGRVGNACAAGICHAWADDGRCISLLKVLFTNKCVYDCKYCVNRRSADVARAAFEPVELANLVMEFYRRNYIEGLFLSSAVEVSPDNTAEKIFSCLYMLREQYEFSGYIHAKIVPGVSPELLHLLGLAADRLSVNIELPSKESLSLLAPYKKAESIFNPMKQITQTLAEQKTLKGPGMMGRLGAKGVGLFEGNTSITGIQGNANAITVGDRRKKYKERFAPGGQSTQMIIGASPDNDRQIIRLSEALYRTFLLKRVYFSAYIAVNETPELPPLLAPPQLKREHRLYQADWLLRFYGFTAAEILDESQPFLDTDLDPKISWALRHIEVFPIELNKASLEEILRVPGIGSVSAMRIVKQRRMSAVKYDDLKKMGVVLKRARFFLTCSGKYYGGKDPDPVYIKRMVLTPEEIRGQLVDNQNGQLSIFDYLNGQKGIGEHSRADTGALLTNNEAYLIAEDEKRYNRISATEQQKAAGHPAGVEQNAAAGYRSTAGLHWATGHPEAVGYPSGVEQHAATGYRSAAGRHGAIVHPEATGHPSVAEQHAAAGYRSTAGRHGAIVHSEATGHPSVAEQRAAAGNSSAVEQHAAALFEGG